MPRSVVVLSRDPDFFDKVRAALRTDSRFMDAGDILHCNGSVTPLTNIYPTEGVTLAGVRRVLALRQRVSDLEDELAERRDGGDR